MDSRTFNAYRELVYAQCGIALRPGKEAMVRARISKRMRTLGIDDHREYLKLVTGDASGSELVHMLDAISTNVTKFFREPEHFQFMSQQMSRWLRAGQRRFRFWSAACSSGEEPYTMAMTLLEACKGYDVNMRILGTDISTRMLALAKNGVYSAKRMAPVSKGVRTTYFEKCGNRDEPEWRVSEKVRKLVCLKRLNLMATPFPMSGPLDIVFCRNVMIYFDDSGRRKLLEEIFRLLKPGGYLLVGHAESLTGMVSRFRSVEPSVYVKP